MKNLCKISKNTGDPANRYDIDEVDEMIMLIHDSFIPAFKILNETLLEKPDEAESDWR